MTMSIFPLTLIFRLIPNIPASQRTSKPLSSQRKNIMVGKIITRPVKAILSWRTCYVERTLSRSVQHSVITRLECELLPPERMPAVHLLCKGPSAFIVQPTPKLFLLAGQHPHNPPLPQPQRGQPRRETRTEHTHS